MMFLIMDEDKAEEIRLATENNESRLEPRLINGGIYASKYALPSRIKEDCCFSEILPLLNELEEVELVIEEAFPIEE